MKRYVNIGVKLISRGLIELIYVIYILSVGILTYFLVSNLPIDHIIAIVLSVGAGLWAAYGVYGGAIVAACSAINERNTNPANGLPMIGEFDIDRNPYGFDYKNIRSTYFHDDD